MQVAGNGGLDVFEAFVTICMLAAAGPVSPLPGETCRIALLPGFAAETKAPCEHASRLAAPQPASVKAEGLPFCALRPRSALGFSEAAPGVFVHLGKVAEPDPANVGDVSNIAFVVGSRGIAVIDAGGSRKVGEEIYLAIRERSTLPITHLILTHMHPDHVFGADPLRGGRSGDHRPCQPAASTCRSRRNLPGKFCPPDRRSSIPRQSGTGA
ncbi:hypothetical protein ABIA27_002475 [Sinorhizobium fredii]